MPNLTMFLFLKTAITIPTEVAEISTYVFMISKIGILLIDGCLDDQLWVSERLFYQHLGIHVHVYCNIQLIENNQVCIVYQMHNNGIKFITN